LPTEKTGEISRWVRAVIYAEVKKKGRGYVKKKRVQFKAATNRGNTWQIHVPVRRPRRGGAQPL